MCLKRPIGQKDRFKRFFEQKTSFGHHFDIRLNLPQLGTLIE